MTANTPSPDDAIDLLRESWHRQPRLTAQELLSQHPTLAQNPAAAVDVIYAEILLREEHGEEPLEAEYVDRFPLYRELITRQFQLHRALSQIDGKLLDSTVPPAKTLAEASPVEAARTPGVPGFEIQAVVGRGGSGIAYRAFDTKLKRTVAIKFLQSAEAGNQRQLIREAEAAAGLVHKNIVQVHQIGDASGIPFLVMEFIDGQSLATRLQSGPLPIDQAVSLLITVANAVQFAHEHNIVHRDLKPGNVLLDHANIPHVCDFGLARKLDDEFTLHATGDVVGTPAYMAPEQARGESAGPAADVYSLGAVLYHCLTGRPPFQAATPWVVLNQVLSDDPVAIRQLNAAIPKDLDTICSAALHKVADRRISSAAEFCAELTRYQSGQPILSRPVGQVERTWKLCRRNPAMSALIGVSVIALAVVAVVAIVSEQKVSSALQETTAALSEANTQRDVAFAAMQNLVNEVNSNLEKHEASVEARGEVLSSAIRGLQQIIDTGDQDPEILLTMAKARSQYGFILAQQGRNSDANHEFELAVQISASIEGEDGQLAHATALALLSGQYLRVADQQRSLKTAQQAVDEFENLMALSPSSADVRFRATVAYENLGSALSSLERHDEGRTQLVKAQTIQRQLCEESPDDRRYARQLVQINTALVQELFAFAEIAEAEAALQEAMQLIESDVMGIHGDTQVFRGYLNCCMLSGRAKFGAMRFEEGIAILEIAKEGYEGLIEVEPLRPGFRLKLGSVSDLLARCHYALGRMAETEQYSKTAIQQFEKGMELGGPEYRVQRSAIMASLSLLTDLRLRTGSLDDVSATAIKIGETMKPLIEEYQLQTMFDDLQFRIAVIQGMAGHPSSADADHVAMGRRSHDAWRSLVEGDRKLFEQSESQLLDDIQQSTHPIITLSLQSTLSMCRGLYYQRLLQSEGTSAEELQAAIEKAIESIRQTLAVPGGDPLFYIGLPDFIELRDTAAFVAAFTLK